MRLSTTFLGDGNNTFEMKAGVCLWKMVASGNSKSRLGTAAYWNLYVNIWSQ